MSDKQYSEGMYSTGEIAKECGVTVRTVQYYDARGLLVPSGLTEGGRRMYSEEDVKKLKFLTYLRSLGLSIDAIGSIFAEENSGKVLETLLEEQAAALSTEVDEKRERLKEVKGFLSSLRSSDIGSRLNIRDVADYMKKKNKMKKVYAVMLALGVLMGAVELGTLILWIKAGIWWPFAVGMALVIVCCILLVRFYYLNVRYICPECHTTFKAELKEFVFSQHTMRMRKLTCPHCGKKSMCVETYREEDEK